MKKLIAVFGLAALAACGGGDAAEGGEGTATVDSSVMTVPGTDTVTAPVVVPTQDTVVQTTTTTTDTVHGAAATPATTTTTDTAPKM